MNIKVFTTVKFSLTILVVLSIFLMITYLIMQRNTELNSHFNSLTNLQLNKLDKLLSANEQAALIRQIVKASLQEIRLLQDQSRNSHSTVIFKTAIQKKVDSSKLQRIFHHGPDMNSNHSLRNSQLKAFQIQTTIEERQMMYRLLQVFDETMKKHNITYIMYGGTLLGSFRHHDLIPWDDDLDVILAVKYHKDMANILKPLLPEFILYRAGGHDKFYHKSAKKASEYNWLWPYLDISYYEENGTYIKDWTKTYSYWYYYPKEIVFPLHNRPLLNLSLPAPRDTFAFLTWTYNYGSECLMYGYSHMVESRGPSGKTDCKLLADKFPFVEHFPHKKGVREVLKYKDMQITDIVVPEPTYAVSETFNLSLKPGYYMPSHITPPPV